MLLCLLCCLFKFLFSSLYCIFFSWALLTFLIFYFMLALVFLWLQFNSLTKMSWWVWLRIWFKRFLRLWFNKLLWLRFCMFYWLCMLHKVLSLEFCSIEKLHHLNVPQNKLEWKMWLSNNILETTTWGCLLHA